MKLLKAATTRWLSHGEASVWIISRFKSLVTSFDEIIQHKNDPELHETRYLMMDPDNMVILLLLAEVLTQLNRFSKFLQTYSLIYTNVNAKLIQLKSASKYTEENNGPLFTKHSIYSWVRIWKNGVKQKTLQFQSNTQQRISNPEDQLV